MIVLSRICVGPGWVGSGKAKLGGASRQVVGGPPSLDVLDLEKHFDQETWR
jgi:hypothetical protein